MFSLFTKQSGLTRSRQDIQPDIPSDAEEAHATTRKINATSALLCEWVSKLLIEQTFFQNEHIAPETLFYVVNDLIQTLGPREKTTTRDVVQEAKIFYKQLRGVALNSEEARYHNAPNKIFDPTTELLNGLRYSSIWLMSTGLYNSVTSAVSQGLMTHLPAIVGYAAAVTVGPHTIRYAVDETLRYTTGLSTTQKDLLRPWLNMIGRLVLGFSPKVHATEGGVHYHYPSTQRYTQTASPNQTVTWVGDDVTLEQHGKFSTPEGGFDAEYVAQFRVQQVDRITQEKVRIRVLDQNGKAVPLEFQKRQGQYGPEIQVVSSDKALERYWQRYFRVKQPVFTIESETIPMSCISTLAIGGAVALVTQHPLPMLMAGFGCIPTAMARDEFSEQSALVLNHMRLDFYKNYFKKMVFIVGLKTQLQLAQQSTPSTQLHSTQDAQQTSSYFQLFSFNFNEFYQPTAVISQMYPTLSDSAYERLKTDAEAWGDNCVSTYQKVASLPVWNNIDRAYHEGLQFASNHQGAIDSYSGYALEMIGNLMKFSGEDATAASGGLLAEFGVPDYILGDLVDSTGEILAGHGETVELLDSMRKNNYLGYDDTKNAINIIACDRLGSQVCQKNSQLQRLWQEATDPNNPHRNVVIQKALAYANAQLTGIRAMIHRQQATEAEQTEYRHTLQGISDTFIFASNLARLFGNGRAAARIQAIGQVTLNLVNALSKFKGFHLAGVVTSLFSTVMPYLAVADAVLKIVSLFSGGGESADDVILQNQKIIMQQLQEISREIQELAEETQQGFQMISKDFQQVQRDLNLIFEQVIQGQEITQEVGLRLQASILELHMQMYFSFKDVLDQSFLADTDRLAILVRSGLAADHIAVASEIAQISKRFFQHGVTDAATQSTRRGSALMFSADVNGESRMIQAEADNLGKLPPSEFIDFFQSYFQDRYAVENLLALVNANMWIDGVNAYLNLLAAFGPAALPLAKGELSRMMQGGLNLLKFGRSVAQTPQLFKDLFHSYINALTPLSNASGVIWQAWQTYVASDPGFQNQVVMPLKQRMEQLTEQVKGFSYDKTPINQVFPSDFPYAVSNSIDHVMRYNLFFEDTLPPSPATYNLYFDSLVQASRQFSEEAQQKTLETIFSLKIPPSFPSIAFSSEGNGPIDVTPVVSIPHDVFLAQILGLADISFSYVFNANHSTRYPTFTITGTYTYKNGNSISFFKGGYEFKPESMPVNWHVNCNTNRRLYVGRTNPGTGGACNIPLVQNPFQDESDTQGGTSCVQKFSPFYTSSEWPPVIATYLLENNQNTYEAIGQSPSAMATYLRLSNMAYGAILTKAWSISAPGWGNNCPNGGGDYNHNNCLKNNTAVLPNIATWSMHDQNTLVAKLTVKKEEMMNAFFNTALNNPQAPGYALMSSALQMLNAAYNRLRGYLYFAFPHYAQGSVTPNATALCMPINPWSANGTKFSIQNGVEFRTNTSGLALMKTVSAIMFRQHEIRMIWSSLDPAEARIGLRLGNSTVFNISSNTHEVKTYYTRIRSIYEHRVEVITALDGFDDQGGQRIEHIWANRTWPSASIAAFVQNSAASTQGIHITQAKSLQLSQHNLLLPLSANWDTVNPSQNNSHFTSANMTFYGVNTSDPIGWTKLQTHHSIGVMNTDIYLAWRANPGQGNMVVSMDLGQQEVLKLELGTDWKPDIWYYSRVSVTEKNITCVTCQDNFDDKRGIQPIRRIQNNRFVTDFVQLAIRISNSTASSGTAFVQVKPIQVIGFEASILPQNMSSAHWSVTNSSQMILVSPEGVTVVGDETYPQGSSLESQDVFTWKHKMLWLKWRLEGAGSLMLQLANQTVATIQTPQMAGQWMYTRVVVFESYVELYTANRNYDLNPDASNVMKASVAVTPQKGGIICTVIPQVGQMASLTIAECTVQNAAPMLFSQMLQGRGLMNRNVLLSELLNNMTSVQNASTIVRALIRRAEQFQEVVVALTDLSKYPQDIDARIATTLKGLLQANVQVAASALNLTSAQNQMEDMTPSQTQTMERSFTVTHSFWHRRDQKTQTKAHTATPEMAAMEEEIQRLEKLNSWLNDTLKALKGNESILRLDKAKAESTAETRLGLVIIFGVLSGVTLSLLAMTCRMLARRRKPDEPNVREEQGYFSIS